MGRLSDGCWDVIMCTLVLYFMFGFYLFLTRDKYPIWLSFSVKGFSFIYKLLFLTHWDLNISIWSLGEWCSAVNPKAFHYHNCGIWLCTRFSFNFDVDAARHIGVDSWIISLFLCVWYHLQIHYHLQVAVGLIIAQVAVYVFIACRLIPMENKTVLYNSTLEG